MNDTRVVIRTKLEYAPLVRSIRSGMLGREQKRKLCVTLVCKILKRHRNVTVRACFPQLPRCPDLSDLQNEVSSLVTKNEKLQKEKEALSEELNRCIDKVRKSSKSTSLPTCCNGLLKFLYYLYHPEL